MLFKASEMDGNSVVPFGDSFSSLVDLREMVSAGDIYPEML